MLDVEHDQASQVQKGWTLSGSSFVPDDGGATLTDAQLRALASTAGQA